MMKAAHALEEAFVERQVLEEELNHGGYLCDEELGEPSREEFFPSPRSKLVINSNLALSSNQSNNINTPEFNQQRSHVMPNSKKTEIAIDTSVPAASKTNDCLGLPNNLSKFQDLVPQTSVQNSAMVVANFMKEAMTKPTLELFKFDGNPTAYSRFISVFETTVEAVEANDTRKLLYLIQHCTGKAKSLIEYCLLLKPA